MIRRGDPIFVTRPAGLPGDCDGAIGSVLDIRRHPRDDRLLYHVEIHGIPCWLPADQVELALLPDAQAPHTTIRFDAEPAESLDDLTRPLSWE